MRRTGVRRQTAHFVIYLANLDDGGTVRLGLAVSRQIGNAVARNRTKRRLRESFRCWLRPLLRAPAALMIVARKGAAGLTTHEITAELKPMLSCMALQLESQSGQPS